MCIKKRQKVKQETSRINLSEERQIIAECLVGFRSECRNKNIKMVKLKMPKLPLITNLGLLSQNDPSLTYCDPT